MTTCRAFSYDSLMTLLGRLSALCEQQDLDALYVFGSRAAEVAAFVRGQGTSKAGAVI